MFTLPKIEFLKSFETKSNFGTYKLSVQETSPKYNNFEYVLNIDRSGSTADMCPDGKTKMEHMHFTIKNMVDYFMKLKNEENIKQFITIIIFDHHPEIICERNEINETFQKNLSKLINLVYPRGSTNIEKALDLANITIEKIKKLYSNKPANNNDYGYYDDYDDEDNEDNDEYNNNVQISHIFMSDGHITIGSNSKDNLKNILKDSNCVNTFIGYGVDHDSKLMKKLGDIKKGEYYFIESLENAGMVYGEVLYNSLYEYLQNIHIKVTDGSIYNYKTNTWDEEIFVSSLSSGCERTWHIKTSENPEKFEIVTYYSTVENSDHGIYSRTKECEYPEGENINKEVEKYLWRQKTQEKLYEITKYIEHSEQDSHQDIIYSFPTNYSQIVPPTPMPTPFAPPMPPPFAPPMPPMPPMPTPFAPPMPPMPTPFAPAAQAQAPPAQTGAGALSPVQLAPVQLAPVQLYPGASSLSKPRLRRNIPVNNAEKTTEYIAELDKFMEELKTYMKKNDLEDDEFMKNLCDDIFVCTKALTSRKGQMYITTRAVSQGRERAYNVRNLDDLDDEDGESTDYSAFRSLSTHTMSEERTTSYASKGATNIMREVSGSL